ncbi:MAG: hypothetical protein A2W19_09280 [Spirochaetes bacterium RBG_16_49_21]|nr:MAG: hypothetical protein A2W19_09280 [Spirochaetes bacterium RBG_16_49_21]
MNITNKYDICPAAEGCGANMNHLLTNLIKNAPIVSSFFMGTSKNSFSEILLTKNIFILDLLGET